MSSCGQWGWEGGFPPLSLMEGSRALGPTNSVHCGVEEFPENGEEDAFTAKLTNQETIKTCLLYTSDAADEVY